MFLNFVAADGVSQTLVNLDNIVTIERIPDGVRIRDTSGAQHVFPGWSYSVTLDVIGKRRDIADVRKKSPEMKIVHTPGTFENIA